MANPSKVELIVEDTQHRSVFQQLLPLVEVNSRVIHVSAAPKGRGSGRQWVIDKAAQLIPEVRNRCAKTNTAAVVVIDGDGEPTHTVLKRLNEALRDAGHDGISDEDNVFVFVPARNIETWIRFAAGDPVDEIEAYPKHSQDESEASKILAEKLTPVLRQGAALGNGAPASLVDAVGKLRKLKSICG